MEEHATIRPVFGCSTAFAHVAVACGIVLLVSLLFAVVGAVDAQWAGGLGVTFCIPAFCLALVFSYAHQKARRGTAIVFGIAIACLLALELGILGLAAHRGRPTPPLTEAERQAPVTEQTPNGLVLCHAQLGFHIPLGTTTLVFSDELTQKAATHASERSVARWVYRESRGSVVIISGARGFDSEESLRNYAKGFTDSADETKEVAKTRESIDWQTGSGSMDLAADTSAGLKLEMRCLASGAGVLVCVETIGANPAELQSFRSGVALESCR